MLTTFRLITGPSCLFVLFQCLFAFMLFNKYGIGYLYRCPMPCGFIEKSIYKLAIT